MPLDDFSDLDDENLTTVTADLLSQAISTVDNTTNVSYYLGNTDCKAKCDCLSQGWPLSNAYSANDTLATLQKKSLKLLETFSLFFFRCIPVPVDFQSSLGIV